MTVWKTQNKRRPGVYINVVGKGKANPNANIGRTLLPISTQLNWGAQGIIRLMQDSDFKALLGHDLDEPELQTLNEVLKGADTVLLLNNNAGVQATNNDDKLPWVFLAQYPGTKGNDLHVTVHKDGGRVTVLTLFGTKIVDQQVVSVAKPEDLISNDYIQVKLVDTPNALPAPNGNDKAKAVQTKSSTQLEDLTSDITVDLTGGTTESVAMKDLLNETLETEEYEVATTAGFAPDNVIHEQLITEIKHLREDIGKKVRGVIPAINATVNYEGISQVVNGVLLGDGTELPATVAAGYFAGVSSSADAGTSLTYSEYPGAISAYPKLNNEKTIQALEKGQIVFTTFRDETVVIEQDINSLVNITDVKSQFFTKNRVVRTMDTIVNNTDQTYKSMFLGKITNDTTGRDLFKANRVSYLQGLADASIIANFETSDISVEPGADLDSILVNLAIQPVDSMEKLYMTMTVGK